MTRVIVDAGICGFTVAVDIIKLSAHKVRVLIASECEMLSEMLSEMGSLLEDIEK